MKVILNKKEGSKDWYTFPDIEFTKSSDCRKPIDYSNIIEIIETIVHN